MFFLEGIELEFGSLEDNSLRIISLILDVLNHFTSHELKESDQDSTAV